MWSIFQSRGNESESEEDYDDDDTQNNESNTSLPSTKTEATNPSLSESQSPAGGAKSPVTDQIIRPVLPSYYPVHAAVIQQDLKLLKGALKKLPNYDPLSSHSARPINRWDHHGYSPLHLAVFLGWEEGVQALVDAGASPRSRSFEGWSCLQECVSTSQRDILEILFKANMSLLHSGMGVRSPIIRRKLAEVLSFSFLSPFSQKKN